VFRVQGSKCDQCLFSDNKIVNDDRKEEVLRTTLKKDTFFVCHKTDDVCCKGYWDKYKDKFTVGQIAQRLNLMKEV